jgi:hypothetical protein
MPGCSVALDSSFLRDVPLLLVLINTLISSHAKKLTANSIYVLGKCIWPLWESRSVVSDLWNGSIERSGKHHVYIKWLQSTLSWYSCWMYATQCSLNVLNMYSTSVLSRCWVLLGKYWVSRPILSDYSYWIPLTQYSLNVLNIHSISVLSEYWVLLGKYRVNGPILSEYGLWSVIAQYSLNVLNNHSIQNIERPLSEYWVVNPSLSTYGIAVPTSAE